MGELINEKYVVTTQETKEYSLSSVNEQIAMIDTMIVNAQKPIDELLEKKGKLIDLKAEMVSIGVTK